MAQTLNLIQDILKDKFLPAFRNQIGIKPSPFLEMVKKTTATNDTIIAAATFGLNGGVGFGVDGSPTPVSGPQMYKNFEIETVNLYCNIEISDKTIKLGSKSESAMIDALDREVRSAFDAANWNIGRALFGDGSGKLCTSDYEVNGKADYLTVDDTRFLKEGMIVDVVNVSGESPTTVATHRITAIDRVNNRVYFETTYDGDFVPNAHILTLQNSYNREITGLGAVMYDEVATVYGKNKAANPWLKPIVVDAKNNLTDITITNAMRDSTNLKNGDIDLIMMGDDAFNAYQTYMKEENNNFITSVNNLKFKGGHTGFEVLFGNKTAKVVNESFIPKDEVWGVTTKDWKYESTPFDFAAENSSIFTLVPGQNYYRALLTSYGNLICENPGACVRIKNCAMKAV